MSVSKVKLAGVDLAACFFQFDKYRGIMARPTTFDQPAGIYPRLKSAALSAAGGLVDLEFQGPDGPGTSPGTKTVTVKVYIGQVSLIDEARCRVTVFDRRKELQRRVFDKFYRVSFGDGYLEGTEKDTTGQIFRDFVDSIDMLKNNVASDAFVDIRQDITPPEGIMTDGLPAVIGIGEIEELFATDLTVEGDKYRFAGRDDVASSQLPQKTAYSWWIQPGWVTEDNVKLHRPKKFKVYYNERHCIRMEAVDDRGTVAHRYNDDSLNLELEQVYIDNGEIFTLEELLVKFGYADDAMNDLKIARSFMSNSFHGTAIQEDGTDDNRRVREAIKDGWRTLYRVLFFEQSGALGGWADWAFGKINEDGSVQDAAVDCKWVEFFEVLELPPSGITTVDANLAAQHDSPSPFRPRWEMGPEAGVIRLGVDRSKLRNKQNFAVPGELRKRKNGTHIIPMVKVTHTLEDGEGTLFDADYFPYIVEGDDFSKVQFHHQFEAFVYVTATRRMPNNQDRWHVEETKGYSNGDVADQEIPPAELMAVRDYVDITDVARQPNKDRFGPLLNNVEVREDAARRAEIWKIMFGLSAEGQGVAESILLFDDVKIAGAISEVSIVGTVEGEMGVQVLRSKVTVGNLMDFAAVQRRANKRILVKGGTKEAGIERV